MLTFVYRLLLISLYFLVVYFGIPFYKVFGTKWYSFYLWFGLCMIIGLMLYWGILCLFFYIARFRRGGLKYSIPSFFIEDPKKDIPLKYGIDKHIRAPLDKAMFFPVLTSSTVMVCGFSNSEENICIPEIVKGKLFPFSYKVTSIKVCSLGRHDSNEDPLWIDLLDTRMDGLNVRSITIPGSVTFIDLESFYYCNRLAAINVSDENPKYKSTDGMLCDKISNTLIYCPKDKNGSVTIGNTVSSIGNRAFFNCKGLTGVVIPDSVSTIGSDAFHGCEHLTGVVIPDAVTSIGWHAFADCRSLTSVNIPTSVTTIEGYSFESCSGLTSVTIPNSVTSIEASAFFDCLGLTSVNIPTSVTSIGRSAFENCSGLMSVNIPDEVKNISPSAFRNCSSLTSINLPDSVKSIGNSAFEVCRKMEEVTIGDSLTGIPKSTFKGCSSLKKVVLGKSVSSLSNTSFSGDTAVAMIVSKNTVPPTGTAIVWASVSKSIPVYVPCSSIDAYKSSVCWSGFTNFKPLNI